jgi:hypothetical protein
MTKLGGPSGRRPARRHGARCGRRGIWALALLAVMIPAGARPAAAWTVDGNAPRADFEAFSRRFASDAYFYPGHGAAPLGVVGFNVFAEGSYDRGFGGEPFADTTVRGGLTGNALVFGRAGVRKGLPGKIDLGVAVSQALDGDVKLGSAELSYALLAGGAAKPAVGIRLTGTRTLSARAYALDQEGAEILVSKGFLLLTPYAGVGIVHSSGRLRGDLRTLSTDDTRGIAYAGLSLNLLLPKITVEVEKGEVVQGRVRVAFGF